MEKLKARSTIDQLILILIVVVLFFDTSFISKFTDKSHLNIGSLLLPVFANISLLSLILSAIKTRTFKNPVKDRRLVLLPISIYSIILLQFLDSIPRWDGSQYFQALVNAIAAFDFSFKSFIENFNFYHHTTMGYALVTSIPQLLNPTNLSSLVLTNLVLGAIGIYSFYIISTNFFGKSNKVENLLLTIIFGLNPLFIGISTTYGPDFGNIVFFLATLASFSSRKYLLATFFGTLLIFTKETGAYVYGLFAISYLLLIELRNFLIRRKISTIKVISLITPILLYLIYLVTQKNNLWSPDGNSIFTWGDDCRFCFGIKQYNLLLNLSVIYLLNFQWLMTIFIVLGFVKNQILSNKEPVPDLHKVIQLVLAGYTAFFCFFIIYVTPRYMSLGVPLITILFYPSLRNLILATMPRRLVMLSLILLLLIQTFRTIDPISKYVFGTYQFGNHQILKVGTEYLGDGAIYNTQYIYVQRLIDKFISEYKISDKDSIFIDPYAWGTFQTGWGRFISAQPKIFYNINQLESLPSDIYYISFPLMEYGKNDIYKIQLAYTPPIIDADLILGKLKSRYRIASKNEIKIDGYVVTVYQFRKSFNEK